MKLSRLPPDERPRERLLAHGPAALSTAELLAILIGSGTPRHSALDLAHQLVAQFDDLTDVSVEELCSLPGVGQAKALKLRAALALALRLHPKEPSATIRSAYDAYAYLHEIFEGEKREIFGALLLDTKSRVIKFETISIGTLSQTLVHPRETFRPAIRAGAASVILVHNHPSGDPTPSEQDVILTKQLVEGGELLGIRVVDHLVYTRQGFRSALQNDTHDTNERHAIQTSGCSPQPQK